MDESPGRSSTVKNLGGQPQHGRKDMTQQRKIRRRAFLGRVAAGAAAVSSSMIAAEKTQPGTAAASALDRFGGMLFTGSEKTGQFRVERINGRHILITPEGHGFLCLGINHANTLALDGTLFQQVYGGSWDRARDGILRQMRAWGFNTLGYGAPAELYHDVPHFVGGFLAPLQRTGHYLSSPVRGKGNWFKFPDVFDAAWQQQAAAAIRAHCEQFRDDPFLIGFRLHDAPTWDVFKTRALRGTEWVSEIRRLDPDHAGKQQYVRFLQSRYQNDIHRCATLYDADAASFDDLLRWDFRRIPLGRPPVIADDRAFLGVIAQQYYSVVGRAFRAHAPQRLFFGEMFLCGDMPDEVLRAARDYIDAVMIQQGDELLPLYTPSHVFPEEDFERIHRITGKPILIGDHQIGFVDDQHPDIVWGPPGTSEQEAARLTEDYLARLFAKPYVLGYMRCTYRDHWASRAEGRGHMLKRGLVSADGQPHAILVAAYQRSFARITARIRDEVRG